MPGQAADVSPGRGPMVPCRYLALLRRCPLLGRRRKRHLPTAGLEAVDARAGLHRQFLFGGLRIGMYEPVKKLFMGERPAGEAPLYLKIAAGLTTGALAIMVANPTDLVKARPPCHAQRMQLAQGMQPGSCMP